jgi:hypothetical protein
MELTNDKHDESFRIVDRRLFTADGELRKEALEQERQEQARQEQLKAQKATQPPSSQGQPAAQQPAPSRPFQMLVNLLTQNAAMCLGGYADPTTGRAVVDLEAARDLIDILEMLREKTKDRLAADDDRLLAEVLGSLKMSFLEVSKAAAQAMRERAPAGANPTRKP